MKLNLLGKTAFFAGGNAGSGPTCAKALLPVSVRALIVVRDPKRWQCAVESIGFGEGAVKKRRFSVGSANLIKARDVSRHLAHLSGSDESTK